MAFDLLRSDSAASGPEWEDVYRRHAADLRKLIARRVPADAPVDDLLQEVFYQAYRSRDRVDLSRPVWGWLATVAHRVCIAWWRQQRPERVPWGAEERMHAAVFPGSDEHLAAMVDGEKVSVALARLSPRHRFLLFGHTAEDLSCEGLAQFEGTTAKAVKSALDRARTQFRRHLEGLPVTVVAGKRWLARHQRAVPAVEGVGPWVGAAVALGVIATLSVAPVAMRAEERTAASRPTAVAPEADAVVGVPTSRPPAPPAPPVRSVAAPASAERARAEQTGPPAGTVVASGVRTHAEITRTPEGTWTTLDVSVPDPVFGDETTVTSSIRCRGAVATTACGVGRALPSPDG